MLLAVNQAKFMIVGMLAVISTLEDSDNKKAVMKNFYDGYSIQFLLGTNMDSKIPSGTNATRFLG